jgi:secernin
MHAHPSGFTWGNTAASAIAVLPERGRPYLWWAAATPCTSLYVPVSARAGRLPAQLGKAGRHAPAGADPERAGADACADDSYWWIFQRLLEAVAGDELGSRYDERQPVVRKRFDALQERWLGEVDGLVRRDAPEEAWGDLTDRCVGESRATAQELLKQFGAG